MKGREALEVHRVRNKNDKTSDYHGEARKLYLKHA